MQTGVRTLPGGTFSRHLLSRKHRKGGMKRAVIAGLMLTPMVDMFSLLVIFLLQSFSASPEMIYVGKNITLPNAVSGIELADAAVLSISSEGVVLDQKSVGTIDQVMKDPTLLMEMLSAQRELWMKTHPDQEFPGKLTLQAHREVPGNLVAKFLGMLPSQHYGTVQLAVVTAAADSSGGDS